MDPFSIVAGVIAAAQAGDRLIQLASRARLYFSALEEIVPLIDEVSDLRLVLDTIHTAAPNIPEEHVTGFRKVLGSCNRIIQELERILNDFLSRPAKANTSVQAQMNRIRWLKRRDKVESLRQQLRDTKSTLTLQILSISHSVLFPAVITEESIRETSSDIRTPRRGTRPHTEHIDEKHEAFISEISYTGQSMSPGPANRQTAIMQRPRPAEMRQAWGDVKDILDSPWQLQKRGPRKWFGVEPHSPLSHDHSEPEPLQVVDNIDLPGAETQHLHAARNSKRASSSFEGIFCANVCECSCHQRLTRHLRVLNGHLGSLLISCTGQPLNPQKCDRQSCIRRSTPKFLAVCYVPRWLPMAAVSLAISNGGRPHIALSFPRVAPPDSDLFTFIRTGQCGRVKELLETGKASVADIAAPYGLTPLKLAIIYGQVDVCRLLIQAGAHQLAPKYTWTMGDLLDYFDNYSLTNSSLPAGELFQDYIRLYSPESQMNTLRSYILEPGFRDDSLTRLHKCVLGLTSETIDIVGRISRHSINETDSIGRTALHWAVYTDNASIVDVLLRNGADPNIRDSDGNTPLHIAAGLGSTTCVKALIAGGANLELKTRFGCSPLHQATIQGHIDVMEILLNGGADCDAENYVGETPLSYATLGIDAVKALLAYGAELEHEDKWGYTPVSKAIFLDCHEVLDFLLKNTRTTAKLLDGKTLLHIAALNSNLRTTEALQNARLCGIDTAAVDAAGYTALEYLRQRKDAAELIEPFGALLLSIAANPNNREEEGFVTPKPTL